MLRELLRSDGAVAHRDCRGGDAGDGLGEGDTECKRKDIVTVAGGKRKATVPVGSGCEHCCSGYLLRGPPGSFHGF